MNLTLLCVDDSEIDTMILARRLKGVGITCDSARNRAEALERFDPGRHAVVVLDWNLPDGTGLEIAQALRARAPGHPLIFLSGCLSGDALAEAGALAPLALLEKTCDLDFLDRLQDLLTELQAQARRA